MPTPTVQTGLDSLLLDPERHIQGGRIGLVANHTAIAADYRHAIEHFRAHPRLRLTKLFSPEHGLYGIDQDMIGVADGLEPGSGLPIISLYGDRKETLSPALAHLDGIDTLVFDVQDIGARYYTFIYTMANCMRICKQAGKRMVVCDRPNPLNGAQMEGNLVRRGFESFVGEYPLPNRHGMTAGELALLFNRHFGIGCDLSVVPMQGWKRGMWFDETGLPWVSTSPNMPALSTATVYPGMCLIEATKLSEGRGTTLPFEQSGAPYIDSQRTAAELNRLGLPGVYFRPHYFKPTFHKWAGQACGGIFIHVTDRARFQPVLAGIAILRAYHQYPEFAWRAEAYEFESDRPAVDLLYGNAELREQFMRPGASLQAIADTWRGDLANFAALRQDCLLYRE